MKLQATYANWDFIGKNENGTDEIWGINPDENGGYLFLELLKDGICTDDLCP
ncbi:MAG: hypothetical protein ACLFQB_15550 [Chitinispirillaceae bacterium]